MWQFTFESVGENPASVSAKIYVTKKYLSNEIIKSYSCLDQTG